MIFAKIIIKFYKLTEPIAIKKNIVGQINEHFIEDHKVLSIA